MSDIHALLKLMLTKLKHTSDIFASSKQKPEKIEQNMKKKNLME